MIQNSSVLPHYRFVAGLLLLLALVVPFAIQSVQGPDWLGALIGLPAYITLIVVTYRRLKDAALSGGWIWSMIIVANIGPSWQGPGDTELYLGNLIIFIPLTLAWVTPANSGANPRPALIPQGS
jgi:uncharacterized membrane protein YhaH (DUF805 family)